MNLRVVGIDMYVITYSLRDDEQTSNNYYSAAALFTDEVLIEARKLLHEKVGSYISCLKRKNERIIPSEEEGYLELLILGTLWKIYSGDSMKLGETSAGILTALSKMRQEFVKIKHGVDAVKGILSTMLLAPDLYDNMLVANPDSNSFDRLLVWLAATGEFKQEVKRLKKWREYLAALPHNTAVDVLESVLTLAVWFEIKSMEALGRFTTNVERYLNEVRPERYWHEDVIFCGRRRVEYHLNMVGAEIMNRAYRNEFLGKRKKVIVLPSCMRILSGTKCGAKEQEGTLVCSGCSKTCIVNKTSSVGKKHGFPVVMVPHESSISNSKNDLLLDKDTGVIGVACVLNLISGGWMLREKGIPAQCVLLDYCGCKNHWHNEGLPTELNMTQLKRVMNVV